MADTPDFRSWSYDSQRYTVAAPALAVSSTGGSLGVLLEQWVPPQPGSSGAYAQAQAKGIEGVMSIQKVGVGDYVLVLRDTYQRIKRCTLVTTDPANTSPFATTVRVADGSIASGYPNQTDFSQQVVASSANGDGGTAVASTQPWLNVASATFPAAAGTPHVGGLIGQTLVDGSGVVFTIVDNTATKIYVAGTVEPGTGTGWKVLVNGAVMFNHTTSSGSITNAAFAAATFTDSSAAWNINQFKAQLLLDSNGNTFFVQSNTQTVLTLASVSATVASGNMLVAATEPVTGEYQILNNFPVGAFVQQCSGIASSSSTNSFTPTFVSTDAMFEGQFAGMVLQDSAGNRYPITDNSTSVMYVASITNPQGTGTASTPATGAWSVLAPAGAASVEVLFESVTLGSTALTGAPTIGTPVFSGASDTVSSNTAAQQILGATGTSTGGVTTLSAGTSTVAAVGSVAYAAHALIGSIISDGSITAVVLDNTAITTTTATGTTINGGSITTSVPLGATITVTGVVTTFNFKVTPTGTIAAGTGGAAPTKGTLAVTSGASVTTQADPVGAALPLGGESFVVELEMSR